MGACHRADLSLVTLHLRYVALGGVATLAEMSDHMSSGAPLPGAEHDVVVHAINERFLERDDPERLPYEVGGKPR